MSKELYPLSDNCLSTKRKANILCQSNGFRQNNMEPILHKNTDTVIMPFSECILSAKILRVLSLVFYDHLFICNYQLL